MMITQYVVSPVNRPFIVTCDNYRHALDTLADIAGKPVASGIHGTRVIVDNEPVARLHHVTRPVSVYCLRLAAEIESAGYAPHANRIRHAVGQAEAHNVSDMWDYLDAVYEESLDAVAAIREDSDN